jgi:hypothetical protein
VPMQLSAGCAVWASADGPATANTTDNIAHNTNKAAKRPHPRTEPIKKPSKTTTPTPTIPH